MTRWLLVPALVLCAGAQAGRINEGAAGTHHAIKRLQTDISVLHITAHPDDEDAALLTTLSRGYGYRTALLSLNRGEGGANLAGPEMYDALGLLRTEETLAAARHYGVDLFYTLAVDFGFSKSMDETLEHWGKENVLRDVVKFIRRWKPDIIVARFHGKPRDGHGNHQTAGLMAVEAFRAAADAKQFHDAGPAWSAKKLYLSTRGNEPSTLRIKTDVYDPLLAMTYRELGAAGYRHHRTQGMAAAPWARMAPFSTLQLVESRLGAVGTEDNIGAGLSVLVPALAAEAMKAFDPHAPWNIAPILARGLPDARYADTLQRALALKVDAMADGTFDVAVPGQTFTATVRVTHEGTLEPGGIRLIAPQGWSVRPVKQDGLTAQFELTVPADAKPTRPYWSRKSEYADHMYTLDEPAYEFLPFAPPELRAEFRYTVGGHEASVISPVETQQVDRLWGPQRRPLAVAPPLSVALSPRAGVIPAGSTAYKLRAELRSYAVGKGVLKVGGNSVPFEFGGPGEVRTFELALKFPAVQAGESRALEASAEFNGRVYKEGFEVAGYRGLQPHHLFRPAVAEIRAADLKIAPGLRVGYISGAGDTTLASMEPLGVIVQNLSAQDLASGDLSGLHAIVVGIRASAVRSDWKAHRERLLRYVENGGHLIVQYQTQEFDEAPYGPYPYKVTARAEEVSEEAARVTILAPQHPLFTVPNRITEADFDGWVEERGSKWMAEWDPRYTALLEAHDREQAPQKGGLVTAQHGKGYWTYAAYAFYRQLPAGVPGAYRLFANLLSLTAVR